MGFSLLRSHSLTYGLELELELSAGEPRGTVEAKLQAGSHT